jgi:hypothetical protein
MNVFFDYRWIYPIHILYHTDVTLSLCHLTHIMDTRYRDIMCRYEDILSHVSCVVTKTGMSCVCVCVQHNLCLMLVSLQLFKDTNVT